MVFLMWPLVIVFKQQGEQLLFYASKYSLVFDLRIKPRKLYTRPGTRTRLALDDIRVSSINI